MTLNDAIAARNEALAKLVAAADATANGRATANAACGEVERIAEFERSWIERHAKAMQGQAQAGVVPTGKIDPFELDGEHGLVMPPSTAGAIMAKRHAEITLDAAEQAVTRLEAEERDAGLALEQAERRERDTYNALLRGYGDHIVAIARQHWREFNQCFERLTCLDADNRDKAVLSQAAIDFMRTNFALPSLERMLGGSIVVDINSPLGGMVEPLANAREFWADAKAQIYRDAESAPAHKAAA